MTGRGRPPVGPRVVVRLPDELLARVDRDAERAGETRSQALRRIIAEHFA